MKSKFQIKLFAAFFVLFSSFTFAQFDAGKTTVGVGAGFGGGGLDGSGAIPITLEINFLKLSDNLQGGIFAAYASTTEEMNFFTAKGEWSYTNIIVAAQTNYHFSPGATFDPFAGVALGYNIASASWSWDGNTNLSEPSATVGGFFYSGQVGFNYWLGKSTAIQLRAGYFPYVSASIHFSL
ncbi:hypothetical protein ASZ90_003846 [hydrocarbon metagenome]|uniref:Outer membrane protein beta-barrel domain-containing protein n=1 Tax=hydrocarbon metagenome TaxID=938273 RepID=A0A0W8FZQ8_9ZZZZ